MGFIDTMRGQGHAVESVCRVLREQGCQVAALTVLREHVLGPILAGVRTARRGRKPSTWTRIDDDYQTLRLNMQTLFHDLGIAA